MATDDEVEETGLLYAVSILLRYPDDITRSFAQAVSAEEIRVKARRKPRRTILQFADWYAARSVAELESEYVEAFDFNRRASLHLTYHLYGDSRQRGLALVKLRRAYHDAGLEATDAELPDYLPMMLEFASIDATDTGMAPLLANREPVELIHRRLTEQDSQFASLIGVISSALPRLTSRQERRIRRLEEQGPPSEQVGLEPFAPPETMPREDDIEKARVA